MLLSAGDKNYLRMCPMQRMDVPYHWCESAMGEYCQRYQCEHYDGRTISAYQKEKQCR